MYASDYGGFTNFSNPQVRQYNIAIAVAAAKLGVDDILYDYIRRPDGPIEHDGVPGSEGRGRAVDRVASPAETRKALRPYKTFLGASVFGIAATHPEDVAQDIPMMARDLDYVSPMVYPSHWGPGEYDVADPNSQPYDIVNRSLADFERLVKGTGSRVVPWLQDFSLGVTLRPDPGVRPDPRREGCRRERVPALGSGGDLHGRRHLRDREDAGDRDGQGSRLPKDAPGPAVPRLHDPRPSPSRRGRSGRARREARRRTSSARSRC